MAAVKKYPEAYEAVIPIITERPGITVQELVQVLVEKFGHTHDQMEKVVLNMMYQHKFVHVQTSRNGKATYECYMAVPPGIEPYRFKLRNEVSKTSIERLAREQRQREKKAKEKAKGVVAQAVVAAPQKANPEAVELWNRHFATHPKLKPFVPTINIENRDGQVLTLTLEEARRMYEQLHAYFGG